MKKKILVLLMIVTTLISYFVTIISADGLSWYYSGYTDSLLSSEAADYCGSAGYYSPDEVSGNNNPYKVFRSSIQCEIKIRLIYGSHFSVQTPTAWNTHIVRDVIPYLQAIIDQEEVPRGKFTDYAVVPQNNKAFISKAITIGTAPYDEITVDAIGSLDITKESERYFYIDGPGGYVGLYPGGANVTYIDFTLYYNNPINAFIPSVFPRNDSFISDAIIYSGIGFESYLTLPYMGTYPSQTQFAKFGLAVKSFTIRYINPFVRSPLQEYGYAYPCYVAYSNYGMPFYQYWVANGDGHLPEEGDYTDFKQQAQNVIYYSTSTSARPKEDMRKQTYYIMGDSDNFNGTWYDLGQLGASGMYCQYLYGNIAEQLISYSVHYQQIIYDYIYIDYSGKIYSQGFYELTAFGSPYDTTESETLSLPNLAPYTGYTNFEEYYFGFGGFVSPPVVDMYVSGEGGNGADTEYITESLYLDYFAAWDDTDGWFSGICNFFVSLFTHTLKAVLYNLVVWILVDAPLVSNLTRPIFLSVMVTSDAISEWVIPLLSIGGLLITFVMTYLFIKLLRRFIWK